MRNYTHDRVTKSLFPWIPSTTIHKINKQIDNPGVLSHTISKMVDNTPLKTDMLSPDRIGHRKYGHNMTSSMLLAVAAGMGTDGILGAWSHLMGDMWNDSLRKAWGSNGAALFEAAYNYSIDQNRKRNRMFRAYK